MNKKPIYWICCCLMAGSFAFSMASRTQLNALDPQDYAITLTTLLDVFAAQPILYISLGLICGLKLFGVVKKEGLRLGLLLGGLALILFFGGIAVASVMQVPFHAGFFGICRYLFKTPGFFLVPGILLGMGINRA